MLGVNLQKHIDESLLIADVCHTISESMVRIRLVEKADALSSSPRLCLSGQEVQPSGRIRAIISIPRLL